MGIARRISTRHPEDYSISKNGLTLTHRSVTEDFGDGPILRVSTSSTQDLTALVYFTRTMGGSYEADTLQQVSGGFQAILPVLKKGERLFYHIEVFNNSELAARFPPESDQFIKFKGRVPGYILIPHIVCMFATVFFGLLTVFSSVSVVRGSGDIRKSVRYLFWTVVFAFIGGFPLGYLVAYLAFGQGWEGVPIGWDITDNKTVILFLFWLATFILTRRGLKGEPMTVSKKVYMYLAMTSFIVTFIAFLVPHSI